MIETIIRNYLAEKLKPTPVTMEKPSGNPKKYVLVEKTGSSCENGIWKASIAIQSYDESLYKAAMLNEQVIAAMYDITALDNVSKCDLDSDYNFTNTTTKEYRYQAVFDITYNE